uniref:Large ribosomal subunit protein uL16m n=1 Tax=Ciona intestinalis TaxID=7719 RepID=H2XPC5_CIOIN
TMLPVRTQLDLLQTIGKRFLHRNLKYGQYGVVALSGGFFKIGNFNFMMQRVNKFIKKKPLFAKWRIPAPYHAVTKHPLQAVMGGGKGKIDHYVTPVKSRQIILEIGGKAEFTEIYPLLNSLAVVMPVKALPVDAEMLQAMYDEERRIEEENENFFTFREVIEKNMQGIRSKMSKRDFKHYGKM